MSRPGSGDGWPLRVLHVDAAREWRGGQNQLRLLARELAGRPEVEQGLAAGAGSRLGEVGAGTGVVVRPLPWGPALDPRAVAGLAREAADWDVLHAHSSHALQAALLGLALSGAPARLVASRRLDFPVRSPGVWRRADLVLCVSAAVRRVLSGCGVEAARTRVVRDAVDPSDLTPRRPGRLREAAGVEEGAPLVGAVGALVGHKDHGTFVRAAARIAAERPDVRFVVAGEGPERSRLERLAAERGLGDRVRLPGHVPGVARSLRDLDCFVMCSREEGLGSAALEALAAGVPAVVTRAGGLAEVAGEGVPGVPPGEPDALAAAVLRLLEDPAARAAAVRAGSRKVRRFSVARMAADTLAAYRDVTRGVGARRQEDRRLERRGAARRARAMDPRGAGP